MRGARCILVPTTLLSAVDATLGGKTGIDYGGAKNTVGTFFPADKVLIVPQLLRTLPEKEYRSGLGEVLKHAILSSDDALMRFLIDSRDTVLARDEETVMEMIRLSLEVKISYITRDPEETKGIRSALNLGHTFGHALEKLHHFQDLSHGEAVGIGMVLASFIGTTNSPCPLTDPTGSRRFICANVTGDIDFTSPVAYDQFYAQLVSEIRHGYAYYLDTTAELRLMEYNRRFLLHNEVEAAILSLFRRPSSFEVAHEFTATEIADIVRREYPHLPVSRVEAKEVGRKLAALGFEGRHTRKGTCYVVTVTKSEK